MAINPNPSHKNQHTMYLGRTGSGKSEALRQNKHLPRSGVRCILWDLSHDHSKGTRYYSNKNQFIDAIKRGIKSGKGFRIGWDGEGGSANHEWFCSVVRSVLDGRHLTYVINEELAACVKTSAKAASALQWLQNEGRKYGLVMHSVSQFPEEIPKTVYKNAARFFVGGQTGASIERFAKLLDCDESELKVLTPWEFFYYDRDSGAGAFRVDLKGKRKAKAVRQVSPIR